MRTLFVVAGLTGLLLAGCAGPSEQAAPEQTPTGQTERIGDLTGTIAVDPSAVRIGDMLTIKLTSSNVGDEPIRVRATSTAPMIVTIWRYTDMGWRRMKEFPGSQIRIRSEQTLAPGETLTHEMTIPVDFDWPSAEKIKVSAELNGRPDVRPFELVDVLPHS